MGASLILVDENNSPHGTASWEEAHASPGKLHRAFSIYLFRKNLQETLIQRRSGKKSLWAGTWANSCCSHPREQEEIADAARRRLHEELGIACELLPRSSYVYRADDPSGNGSEHEHVTIFTGNMEEDAALQPNPDEVAEVKWVELEALQEDMRKNPDLYAPWFHIGLKKILG